MDISEFNAVFFDLDGTLVDSAKDLSFAIDVMSEQMGYKKPPLENIKKWIGNGTLKLVERSVKYSLGVEPEEKTIEKCFEIFSQAYRDCVGEHSVLFEGAKELLVKLLADNKRIACITNKPLEFTEFLLKQNMIRQFFSVVCAGDNVKFRKPDPWPLIHASETLGFPIEQCLMIGDSQHDVKAARNAGCKVLAVSYGYNHGEDIANAEPDAVIDSFTKLL